MNLTVGIPNLAFSDDKDGFLVRSSPTDSRVQRLVTAKLRERMFHLSHYPTLAGHLGSRKMYDTMRRSLYWPHMANDEYKTLDSCHSFRKNGGHPAHQRHLKLSHRNTLWKTSPSIYSEHFPERSEGMSIPCLSQIDTAN